MTGGDLFDGVHLAGLAGIAVAVVAAAAVAVIVVRDRRRDRACADRPGSWPPGPHALGVVVAAVAAVKGHHPVSDLPGYAVEAAVVLIVVLLVRRWLRS